MADFKFLGQLKSREEFFALSPQDKAIFFHEYGNDLIHKIKLLKSDYRKKLGWKEKDRLAEYVARELAMLVQDKINQYVPDIPKEQEPIVSEVPDTKPKLQVV